MAVMRQNVVLVVCLCLLFLQTATSFTSVYQKARYVKLSAAKSDLPTETVGGYIFADRVVNNVTLTTGGNSTGKPKRTVVSKNPRDWTPYVFRDADGEYDAPFINDAMWYRLSVRRNSEKKLAESLKQLRDSDENWGNMFEEVYYPQQPVVRIKDKSLVIAFKAMAPGLVYIKTKMNPDLADDIESIKGVYAFLKNPNNLIVPLSKSEGESIELMRDRNTAVIDPELMLMKKDEYVSVVSGPRKGRYGILMGAKNGKLEVCLRSDYKDDWDTFEFDQLRYLADPPEKKWMLLTPKEALESLMAKDPYNPTVKAFKKNGLLEEILYPDGRPEGYNSNNRNNGGDDWGEKRQQRSKFGSEDESRGREGGRSVRSIATNKDSETREKAVPSSDMDDWGAMSTSSSGISTKSPEPTSSFDNSFNIAAWGDSLSAATGGAKKKNTDEKVPDKRSAEADEGFESFLQEAIEELKPAGESDDRSSGGRLIVSGGRREYIPNQEYQQKAQASQPKQAAKRDFPPYSASKPKSNDWFDETSSYDSFGSDSAAGTSRSTRSSGGADVNPQVEADRLDSERILNELLMDLDTGDSLRGSSSSSDREVDYFDFSMDSEDLKSSAKPAAPRQQTTGNSRAPMKSAGRNNAPQMEDFVSFELYLDALVSHERSAIGGGNNYMDGASGKKSSSFNSRPSGDSDNRGSSSGNRDFDALDDNLVAFLGGEDEDDSGSKGSSRGPPQNSRSSRDRDSTISQRKPDDSKQVRSWNPKAAVAVVEEAVPIDDLSRFLDSLEESNVLPNRTKAPVEEAEKEVKAAPTPQSVAEPASVPQAAASSESYSRLSLKDLKDKLRERGLPVSGNKAELVTRLSA